MRDLDPRRAVPWYRADVAEAYPGVVTRLGIQIPTARPQSVGLAAWPAEAPLFVGIDGERITRGTLQYRVLRAFKKAGVDGQRARGALVHGLRHTDAIELANADVKVSALMKLLGHESMVTSQRYVAAGAENRAAAGKNPLYSRIEPSGNV